MNKAQKIVTGFFAAAIIIIAVLSFFYFRANFTGGTIISPEANASVLYYGETCPHCKIVEEFMSNNSVESKMDIIQKEVFSNKTNAEELLKVGEACKLQKDYMGAVPLLYSGGKCYVGDKDIISFFQEKLNITASA